MTNKIHNLSQLKEKRKKLRNELTPAEAALWKHLQKSGLEGKKFRRQHSAGPYIMDFYCPEERLAIELDGEPHFNGEAFLYDTARTQYLESLNIRVLRFENRLVFENLEGVLAAIRQNFSTMRPAELAEEG